MPRADATPRARRPGARRRPRGLRRLGGLLDQATTPALLVRDDGTVDRVNQAFSELVGVPADALAGASAGVLGLSPAALVDGEEVALRTAGGRPLWVRVVELPHTVRRARGRLLQVLDLRPSDRRERAGEDARDRRADADDAARARRRQHLVAFAREALAAPDPAWVLDRAAAVVREVLDVPLAAVLAVHDVPDDAAPQLRVVSARGWRPGFTDQTFDAGTGSHGGWALEHGTTVSTPAAETRFPAHRALAVADALTGVATPVPAWGTRAPSAVVVAYATTARAITPEDVAHLELLATVVAPAVERRRLQPDLTTPRPAPAG